MRNPIKISILIIAVLSIIINANAQVKTEIEKANKEGNVVFLVVTEGNKDVANAKSIAEKASKSYKKSKVLTMDMNDKKNSTLISKYRLQGAPMPLIIVIATNGVVTGGAPADQLKAEDLVNMIPTPKLEELYASIADGKPTILAFTKKSFKDRTEVIKECKKAISLLKNNASLVEVNIDDSKEENFLKQLRIDKSSESSIVLVINKQGQVSGTATTVPDAKKLAEAATAIPKGGCGPGCGPTGCGK